MRSCFHYQSAPPYIVRVCWNLADICAMKNELTSFSAFRQMWLLAGNIPFVVNLNMHCDFVDNHKLTGINISEKAILSSGAKFQNERN